VCARAMTLPPLALWTSMRVEDSLERGVSFFMAELQRLKAVVEAAHAVGREGERRLLYLLDEILQGTNTAERQIAARRIIMHLVREGAIGAVSTHDLTLAEAPDLAEAAHPVHFSERFSREDGAMQMTFDYKLKPGIATSTNALKLMEMVGLDLD
jgi:DNA mismatch repair ATPase MutS